MQRLILLALCLLFASLILSGCLEGQTRHDVDTGGDGTLKGLVITPTPQTLGINTDEEFLLEWRPGTTPPAHFTVALSSINVDNTTESILTQLTVIETGRYRIRPSLWLPSEAFILLTVNGAGETVRAIYLTESALSSPNTGAPTSAGSGSFEHVINTR